MNFRHQHFQVNKKPKPIDNKRNNQNIVEKTDCQITNDSKIELFF